MQTKTIIPLIAGLLLSFGANAASLSGSVSCQAYTESGSSGDYVELEGDALGADLADAESGKTPEVSATLKVPKSNRTIDVSLSFIYEGQIGGPLTGVSVSAQDSKGKDLGEFEYPVAAGFYALTIPTKVKGLKVLNIQCNVNVD